MTVATAKRIAAETECRLTFINRVWVLNSDRKDRLPLFFTAALFREMDESVWLEYIQCHRLSPHTYLPF